MKTAWHRKLVCVAIMVSHTLIVLQALGLVALCVADDYAAIELRHAQSEACASPDRPVHTDAALVAPTGESCQNFPAASAALVPPRVSDRSASLHDVPPLTPAPLIFLSPEPEGSPAHGSLLSTASVDRPTTCAISLRSTILLV